MGWEWLTWPTGHAGTPEPSSRGPTRACRSLPVQGALPALGPSAFLGQGVLGSADGKPDLPGPGLWGQRPPCSPAGPLTHWAVPPAPADAAARAKIGVQRRFIYLFN